MRNYGSQGLDRGSRPQPARRGVVGGPVVSWRIQASRLSRPLQGGCDTERPARFPGCSCVSRMWPQCRGLADCELRPDHINGEPWRARFRGFASDSCWDERDKSTSSAAPTLRTPYPLSFMAARVAPALNQPRGRTADDSRFPSRSLTEWQGRRAGVMSWEPSCALTPLPGRPDPLLGLSVGPGLDAGSATALHRPPVAG